MNDTILLVSNISFYMCWGIQFFGYGLKIDVKARKESLMMLEAMLESLTVLNLN